MASAVAGVGTGLVANYFSDPELRNLAATRVDPTVDFAWGHTAPLAGIGQDQFSVRWVGKVQAQFDESYTFYTTSDEGVALWINGQKLIDNFTDHTLTEDSGTITLEAGETYDIRIDYYDNAFDATMKLSWSSDSTPKQVIPATQLYADAGHTSGAFLNASVGGAAGSVSSAGRTYKVVGGGHGTSGSSDRFHYLYQTLNGDGVLTAQVAATQGTSGGAEAGVMIRDTLAANSSFASVVVNANGVASFETRASDGASVSSSAATASGNSGLYWVRLVRDGDFFRGYASASGADDSWKYFGSLNVPMDRSVHAGVTATSGTNGGTNPAQFKNVDLRAAAPIGGGLDQVRDYSMGQVFVDMARQARTPARANFDGPVSFDANGWATEDFMTILATGYRDQAHLLNGTYKVSFTGQADLGTWLTPGGQIRNKAYNAATNTTTADFVVNASQSQDNWYAALQFFNTRREPNGPDNTGITNLKVIRPGYAANTTQVFQDSYLKHLESLQVLRFMDWGATNNNQVAEWSERTTPQSARQSSTSGVAWEYMIELANQLDKDLWINIPHKASDDYVRQLANLIKNTLEPERIVYVEYSNEVWNGIFTQNQENLAMALAEVAEGNSPLNADGETNGIYWGWRRVANQLYKISQTFRDVMGESAINGRIRPVLAGQHANPDVVRQGIEFIERTYGAPSRYIYGVAVAPYTHVGSIDNTNPNMTADEILDRHLSSALSNANRYWSHDTYARRYGLVNLAYEGGPDAMGSNNLAAKKEAMLAPRMKDVTLAYLNGWYQAGGGLFAWFVAGPTVYSSNGMWGVTNNPEQYDAPKAQALEEIATGTRTPLKYGHAIPGTFDARAVGGANQPYPTSYRVDPGAGNSFDYFIRAPRAGRYRVTLSAGTAGNNEQIRVIINDSAVRTITLNDTGSGTIFQENVVGTFELQEGMNLIRLTSIRETSWNIATVTVEGASTASNGAPTIAQAAAASPVSVSGKTTGLSVLGADDGGESKLVYSWEAVDQNAMAVTFSLNGSNAAKNTVATFTKPGTYQLRATISDGHKSTTSSVNVTVNQVLTSIIVTPTGQPVANGETKQLTATAKDQFGIHLYAQPAFSWTVENGFGTVSSTGLYTAPASGLGTATIRAAVGAISATATVITTSPRPADNIANPLPGLEYRYYHGSWNSLPDFEALTPVKSGLISNVSLSPKLQSDNFAFLYTGFVNVPQSGTHTFYLNSDDGSKLWIGGQQVVNNDGKHSLQEKSGSIILDAGWHAFRLGYMEAGGGETLTVSYSGPGIAGKQALPDAGFQRDNRAPTVATPPSASPDPVSGNQAGLSVVGADESGQNALTYTWSATSIPGGAANPTFTVNGTNAAKNTIATFNRAGTYTLRVAISDGSLTTHATLDVTVAATVTSISVAPSSTTLRQGETRQFSATARDQFGDTISSPPPFTWSTSANGGTINASGLYTAPSSYFGTFTVTASINGTSGSASVTVTENEAPRIVTPASASPSVIPAGETSTHLSVLGADDGLDANLTYTWAATVLPAGAAAPTFSANGDNAAKDTVAEGLQPGPYSFTVTISDGAKSVTSSVDVLVEGANSAGPTVVTPASANPATVTDKQTALSVLGGHENGEEGLTYTWSAGGNPPAPVAFSENGTNNAKNVTATFGKAGTYSLLVTISDGSSSVTSSKTVTVQQTLTSVAVAPTSALIQQGQTRQFTASAVDQFGDALAQQPSFTWSVSSTGAGGTISSTGLYTAPTSGTPQDTVTASTGGKEASAVVTVTAPSQIDAFGKSIDIGPVALGGSYAMSGTSYNVKASGADVWGSADAFHFVYKTLTGDGQIVARVDAVQNTNSRAKAGLMFRDDLTPGSKNAFVALSPDQKAQLQYRTAPGGGTSLSGSAGGAAAPYWLKLVRIDQTFHAYRSPDGQNWTLVATKSVTMGETAYVGLALTSHDNAKLNTSTFSNVAVIAAAPLSGSLMGSDPHRPVTSGVTLSDGDPSTYFETSAANGAWVGLDLGAAKRITEIRYASRPGHTGRVVGGKFQASRTVDFSSGVSDLYVIRSAAASARGLATVQVSEAQAFRYVRYVAPNGSFGNLSELAFVGF